MVDLHTNKKLGGMKIVYERVLIVDDPPGARSVSYCTPLSLGSLLALVLHAKSISKERTEIRLFVRKRSQLLRMALTPTLTRSLSSLPLSTAFNY